VRGHLFGKRRNRQRAYEKEQEDKSRTRQAKAAWKRNASRAGTEGEIVNVTEGAEGREKNEQEAEKRQYERQQHSKKRDHEYVIKAMEIEQLELKLKAESPVKAE